MRKHAGMIVPAPVQAAMVAALADERHADEQRERYRALRGRRCTPRSPPPASPSSTPRPVSTLWMTRGEDCWRTVDWLARRGILVAAGVLDGPGGGQHARVALTESDGNVAAVAGRLAR